MRVRLSKRSELDLAEIGEGLRSSAVKSHTIFFLIEPNEVLIVRVLHGARDINADDFAPEGKV